jgi:cyanobactin maturation PatA/PatG family protease
MSGLQELWELTLGDPRISIAVLDGPVDVSHPSLALAELTQLSTLVPGIGVDGPATEHGTHVASVIFGQHDGPVKGIAPRCRGLILPVFGDGPDGFPAPCSQVDLARAITQAVQAGAEIINVSGGELSPSGTADPLLADAVRDCATNGAIIVAAAGNEGCDCLHVPGALPTVLAVGAMDGSGVPLACSNWGERYATQGILAPGENILGASLAGVTAIRSGTSYAAAVVSGVLALLISIQIKRGATADPQAARAAVLDSAIGYDGRPLADRRRLLAGRINLAGAVSRVSQGRTTMTDSRGLVEEVRLHSSNDVRRGGAATVTPTSDRRLAVSDDVGIAAGEDRPGSTIWRGEPAHDPDLPTDPTSNSRWRVTPSGCSCGGGAACTCGANAAVQLVYALGQLGIDFGTEARRDSIAQHMDGNPHDTGQLLSYLDRTPWDAMSLIWTLNVDATPIYAVRPEGAFAGEGYQRLRQFVREQLVEGVERVSIAGVAAGSVRLLSGQVVPVVLPELRCMYSWTTAALLDTVSGPAPPESADADASARKRQAVGNVLERIYHELRGLGLTSQQRAVNYAATNALNVEGIIESALKEEMEFDELDVERSPICRPGSDCWDVKLTFFDPRRQLERARMVFRFTVDVSDVCPVMVGKVRSWSVR